MSYEAKTGLLLFGGLIALFAWSAWAGLAGTALIALWILWLVAREAFEKRKLRLRCRAQLDQTLAALGCGLDAVFHSRLGVAAIGVAASGRKMVYASPDSAESYDIEAIFEARARKLPQGDFEIGFSVPGRTTGKPYWHVLLVKRRHEAARWAQTLDPYLGSRMKVEGLG